MCDYRAKEKLRTVSVHHFKKKVIYLVAVTPHTVEQKIRVATSIEVLIHIIPKLEEHVLSSYEIVCTVRDRKSVV